MSHSLEVNNMSVMDEGTIDFAGLDKKEKNLFFQKRII